MENFLDCNLYDGKTIMQRNQNVTSRVAHQLRICPSGPRMVTLPQFAHLGEPESYFIYSNSIYQNTMYAYSSKTSVSCSCYFSDSPNFYDFYLEMLSVSLKINQRNLLFLSYIARKISRLILYVSRHHHNEVNFAFQYIQNVSTKNVQMVQPMA